MRRDQSLCVQGRDLVTVGKDNDIITSAAKGPKVGLRWMSDVKILQIDRVLVREGIEYALEKSPVLVAVYPVFVYTRLHLFELKS